MSLSADQIDALENNAAGFLEAARRCARPEAVPGSPDKLRSPIPPAIVCLSFCIELLLKLIIELGNGTAPRTHETGKLFHSLPEEIKRSIARNFSERSDASSIGVEEFLENFGNPFVEFRYWHEAKNDIQFKYRDSEALAICLVLELQNLGRATALEKFPISY
jgi:hypothetical protein